MQFGSRHAFLHVSTTDQSSQQHQNQSQYLLDDRLYLHPFDAPGTALIPDRLIGVENYQHWSRSFMYCLIVNIKICFIDGSCNRDSVLPTDVFHWDQCNVCLKSWLMNSVSKELHGGMVYALTTYEIWQDLKQRYKKVDGTRLINCIDIFVLLSMAEPQLQNTFLIFGLSRQRLKH